MSLLLDQITALGSLLPEETVHVPQWNIDVTLRGMSSRERDDFEADNLKRAQAKAGNGRGKKRPDIQPDFANFRARLVARSIVENSVRPFANGAGEEMLGDQPAAVLDRLFSVAQRLSGFTDSDVEELVGNSEATGAEDSSSDSQDISAAPSLN